MSRASQLLVTGIALSVAATPLVALAATPSVPPATSTVTQTTSIQGSYISVTDQNFDSVVAESNSRPVVFMSGASWCRICTALAPMMADIAEKQGGKVLFAYATEEAAPGALQRLKGNGNLTMPMFFGYIRGAEHPGSRKIGGLFYDRTETEKYVQELIAAFGPIATPTTTVNPTVTTSPTSTTNPTGTPTSTGTTSPTGTPTSTGTMTPTPTPTNDPCDPNPCDPDTAPRVIELKIWQNLGTAYKLSESRPVLVRVATEWDEKQKEQGKILRHLANSSDGSWTLVNVPSWHPSGLNSISKMNATSYNVLGVLKNRTFSPRILQGADFTQADYEAFIQYAGTTQVETDMQAAQEGTFDPEDGKLNVTATTPSTLGPAPTAPEGDATKPAATVATPHRTDATQ